MIMFIEHPVFTRRIQELVTDKEYRDFQVYLAANPDAGDVVPGMGGLRKIRLALPGRGKRGGARVLYLFFVRAGTVFFVYAYTKGEFAELPPEKRRVVRDLVIEIKKEFER